MKGKVTKFELGLLPNVICCQWTTKYFSLLTHAVKSILQKASLNNNLANSSELAKLALTQEIAFG